MDDQNIYGIKYEVDIESLKTSSAEAKKSISMANAEFKESASKLDDWANSVDGVSAKIKQMNAILEAEKSKLANSQQNYNNLLDSLGNYESQIDELKKKKQQAIEQYGKESNEVKELNIEIAKLERQQTAAVNSADKLKISIMNQQAKVNTAQKEVDKYNTKLTELQNENNKTASSMEKLKDTISKQENELAELKGAYANVVLEQGKTSAEAQELANKITALNNDLKVNKKSMSDAEDEAEQLTASLNNVDKGADNASDGFTVMKGALAGFISNAVTGAVSKLGELATSILDTADATREYRQMTAKLEGSANSFGYSIEFAKDKYKEFYAYLADDQMATNAITNLMGLGASTETLNSIVNSSIGVWSAYGDSIPIESLTESINETAQVGKVTGSLADALNWAGLSEDEFNKKLEATNDVSKRADMIASALNGTYGESKKTYDALTGTMQEANREALELKETQAELGKTVEPVNTAFTKMKNQALKAMAPMIKDVSYEFLNLLEGINWNKAANSIDDVFDVAIDGLDWLMDHTGEVSALVKGMATAWIAYKTAQMGANAITKTTNALQTVSATLTKTATVATVAHTTATEGATLATKALALAQKMTPWGLVAGLIAGAVVGLTSYIASSQKSKSETDANTEATKKLSEEYKELNETLDRNKEARDENMASAASEIGAADVMAKKLEELSNKENKSNSEKEMMKYYVDELNRLMPDLNLQYDAEKDALNMSTEAIRKNIAMQKQLTLAKASQENMAEIARDMVDAELKLDEAAQQHIKNEEALNKAKQETQKTFKAWQEAGKPYTGEIANAYIKAVDAEANLREAHEESEKTVEKLKKEVSGLNSEYDKTAKQAEKYLDSADIEKKLTEMTEIAKTKGIEIPISISEGIIEGKYALPTSLEEMQSLASFEELVTKAKDSGIKVPKSISEGIANGKLAPSEAVKQMNNLITFNDLLDKANISGSQVPKNISNAVLAGKLTPAEAVQQMKNLVTFDDLLQKSSLAGQKVPQSIQQAVLSGKMTPAQAVAEMNNIMAAEANKSEVPMRAAGQKSGAGYAQGVESGKTAAKNAGNTVAQYGAQAVRNARPEYASAGGYATSGIKDGITNTSSQLFASMGNLAWNMVDTFKRNLQIKSPSRIFMALARFIPEGIRKGIMNNAGRATNAMRNLTNNVVKEGQKLKSKLPINGSMLSELKQRTEYAVQGLRNTGNPAYAMAGASTSVYNVNMNQYNTSPKALDSLEVYRNTQKQVKQFKTWLGGKR